MNKVKLLARGRRFQAEVNSQNESQDLNESAEKKTIDLFIPPSVNATTHLQFMSRLQKTCYHVGNSASIMRIGSYDHGTRIVITINANSFADILDKINGMPEVERLEEYQEANGANSGFLKSFAKRELSTIDPSNRFYVSMKPA